MYNKLLNMLDTHLLATSFARQSIFQDFRHSKIGMKQKMFYNIVSQFVIDVRYRLSRCFESGP